MALTAEDIRRLAGLARIHFNEAEQTDLLLTLNQVLGVIEQLRAVDTTGVVPMTHPRAAPLRQREDLVTEIDQRAAYQENAPALEDGLYLVPKVLE